MSERAIGHPRVILVLMLAVATVGTTLFAMSPLLPDVARSFDVPVSVAGTLPGAYGIALAVSAPIFGLTAHRLARARVIATGLAAFGLAWLFAVFARDFFWLMACAVAAGAATGATLPAAYAYATDLSAPGDRARVLGRVLSGWSVATVLVVPAMSLASQLIDWRWAFGALAVCALLLAAAIKRVAHPAARAAHAEAGGTGGTGGAAEAGLAGGLDAGAIAAIVADLKRVARHAHTRRLLAVNALDMGAVFAVYSFLGAEIRSANDWGATQSGLMFSLYGIGLALLTLNARWIDRIGPRRSALAALALLVAWFCAIPWLVGVPAAMVVIILGWGMLQATFFTSVTALAAEQIPELRGVVIALISGATFLGVAVYSPVAAWLYQQAGYYAVGLLSASGALAALALLRPVPDVPRALAP